MKREEALAPSSRKRYGSLLFAQLLKKEAPVYGELPTDTRGKEKYVHQLFEAYKNNLFATKKRC